MSEESLERVYFVLNDRLRALTKSFLLEKRESVHNLILKLAKNLSDHRLFKLTEVHVLVLNESVDIFVVLESRIAQGTTFTHGHIVTSSTLLQMPLTIVNRELV